MKGLQMCYIQGQKQLPIFISNVSEISHLPFLALPFQTKYDP